LKNQLSNGKKTSLPETHSTAERAVSPTPVYFPFERHFAGTRTPPPFFPVAGARRSSSLKQPQGGKWLRLPVLKVTPKGLPLEGDPEAGLTIATPPFPTHLAGTFHD